MKNYFGVSLLALNLLAGAHVYAAPAKPFSLQSFQEVSKGNGTVVVGFHSPSCGSCKVQKPNLEALLKEDEFAAVQGFLADFEESESFRKSLERPVRGPSTIVIFKNGKELSRIQGVTRKEELRALIKKGALES